MKKIILTEDQIDLLRKNAQREDERRYRRDVKIDVESYRVMYKGMEINDITAGYEPTLTYLIEQEHRSWGIKNISLYDIQGNDEIEVELHLYPDNANEPIIKEVKIPLDWSKLETSTNQGEGVVTIGDRLDIRFYLVDGKFEYEMELEVYNL